MHAVTVKEDYRRGYLQLQEASRDQVLVCPHRNREYHKPKGRTNETTQTRIYEVLKHSPIFSHKKTHHVGWRDEK